MSEWISVEERLPADMQTCLVARIGKVANMYWDEDDQCFRPDGFGFETDETFDDVTHWMPLPPPPAT